MTIDSFILLFALGIMAGFLHIAILRPRINWTAFAWWMALWFGWLFAGDALFYLGEHRLILWPTRPLVFRGGVCATVWWLIWQARIKERRLSTFETTSRRR